MGRFYAVSLVELETIHVISGSLEKLYWLRFSVKDEILDYERIHFSSKEAADGVVRGVDDGLAAIETPRRRDGTRVEHAPAFGAFPVNDLGYGLLTANPRLVALGVEIEDVAFMVAARDSDDPFGFDQSFDSRIRRGTLQSRQSNIELMADSAHVLTDVSKGISLLQSDLVRLVE